MIWCWWFFKELTKFFFVLILKMFVTLLRFFYFILNKKSDAIQFNIDAEILPEWIPTFEECELKGEVTVICDNQVSNGWNGRAVRWDLQACLDSLGCPSAADMDIFYLTADNQMGQENMTYDGLGFWFDMEGNPGPLVTTEKIRRATSTTCCFISTWLLPSTKLHLPLTVQRWM